MEAQFGAPEKRTEASELQEIVLETEAGAGARGLSVVGGGYKGLFVKDVLKDSPAARALSLQEGDQLLSARVYFDNIKYEDALQILKCAEPYKISFCLKRMVPSTDVARRPGPRGPQAKVAKLNLRSMSFLKRRRRMRKSRRATKGLQAAEVRGPGALPPGKQEITPVGVEFFLPRFAKLLKARRAGGVAVAEPSPDLTPKLSSLETKPHRLTFPRLKVKEAAATRMERAVAQLSGGLPMAGVESKKAVKGSVEGKAFRFNIPFPKTKKLKEEAGGKGARGFQALQVEFDLPLPKMGSSGAPPKAAPGRTFQMPEAPLALPRVEVALPRASAGGVEISEGTLPAGLKLPTAEVMAPKLEVDLVLPKLERVVPEAPPKKEAFRIKVPKFGVSAEEEELKLPLMKAPALKETRRKAEASEAATPSLDVAAPAVDLDLPLAKGKADMGIPDILAKVPSVSLTTLGPKAQEEREGKQPQLQASVGRPERPKATQEKSSVIQIPSLEISLTEQQLGSKEGAPAAADSRPKFPEMKVSSLELSAPRVWEGQHSREALPGPSGREESREEAEGVGFRFQMPQVSLPKFAKAPPSPPPVHVKVQKPEGDTGAKLSLPEVDLALPTLTLPDVQLPRAPTPELGICVEKPAVEVSVPPAQLRFPSKTVPALEIELPKVGLELDLAKVGRPVSEQVPRTSETLLETVSKGLEVELSIPRGHATRPDLEPRARTTEGAEATGKVAKIPKVALALAFEKEPAETGLDSKGKLDSIPGAKIKLPAMEFPQVSLPEVTVETSKTFEGQAKLKSPRFALSKLGISSPKAWSKAARSGVEGSEAASLGLRSKRPKTGISFPKWKGGAEGDVDVATEAESRLALPTVDIGLWGKEEGAERGEEVKFKVPKLSLTKTGGGSKEGEGEGEGEGSARELEKEGRASKFRMPSLGLRQRAGNTPASLKEKPRMPKRRRSPPRTEAEAEKGTFHLPGPELGVGVLPQLELPTLGTRAAPGGVPEPESFRVQIPSVEIAVAVPRAKGKLQLEPPALGTSKAKAECQGWPQGELQLPKVPSIGVSAPALELDISLRVAGGEQGGPQGPPSSEARIELPMSRKGKDGGTEAALELPGHQLPFGKEGEKVLAFASGAKIQVPQVDISLPKVWVADMECPLATVDPDLEGPEGKFQMPSIRMPKFSSPRLKAPELEVSLEGGAMPKFKASAPSVKPLKPVISCPERDTGVEVGLPRVPQLELKAPKFRGSSEALSSKAGAKEGKAELRFFPLGHSKLEAETEGSKFKLALPSLRLSGPEAELSRDAQPLCSTADGADRAFKVPLVALPDVGFSVEQEGERGTGKRVEGAGLEVEVVRLEDMVKMPQIGMPVLGARHAKGDAETTASQSPGQGDLEGRKPAFKVPGLEISSPGLTIHAEYEVEAASPRQQQGSQGLEGAGGKRVEDFFDAEAGKRSKVKIPKFGGFLPKVGLAAPESREGQEAEAKDRKPIFALGKPRGKGPEGSSELLEGEEEEEGQGRVARVKLKPAFGLSLAKPKPGAEFNGEAEEGSFRLKVPKLGFSTAEPGAVQLNGERAEVWPQDGASRLSKIRLPQVGLSAPSTEAEADQELNLQLVMADEAREGAPSGPSLSAALKTPKFKSPRLTLSGFMKGSPPPRMEMASSEAAAKGELPTKFRFPKVGLSARSEGLMEVSEPQQSDRALNLKLPLVGFTAESSPGAGGDPKRPGVEAETAAPAGR